MADVAFVANSLGISETLRILKNPSERKCITNPPVNVKGGEVYIFQAHGQETQGKNHTLPAQ